MSLPTIAAFLVNCVPVSCIPSPESPANRIVTRSSWRSVAGFATAVAVAGSAAFLGAHPLVGPRRQIEELLRERLGEELEDVHGSDDADQVAVVVDERDVPVAARL